MGDDELVEGRALRLCLGLLRMSKCADLAISADPRAEEVTNGMNRHKVDRKYRKGKQREHNETMIAICVHIMGHESEKAGHVPHASHLSPPRTGHRSPRSCA